MSECAGCHAPIVWAVTTNGKRVPLDVKPEKRYTVGPLYELDPPDDPGAFTYIQRQQECAQLVDTFMPHHATCPNVDQFRKAKT